MPIASPGSNPWSQLLTTKTFKIRVCGGTYHGQYYQLTASSAKQYKSMAPGATSWTTRNYSTGTTFAFAGVATSTTTGTPNSNLVRTYDLAGGGYCSRPQYKSISTSAAKPIYYRPYITVTKK